MTDKPDTYVGLDLSGSQTRCLVAAGDGAVLRYLGCGSMPPVRWDTEYDKEPQLTSDAVLEAVCEAERETGLTVVAAVVGLGSHQVGSGVVHSTVQLPAERGVIESRDVAEAVRQAARGVTSDSATALQLVPLEFSADGESGLRNPVGRPARRLDAYVQVISIAREDHDEVTSLVNHASFRVEETLLAAFASAYATLADSECVNGVALLDIGKESSSLVAYCGGTLSLARAIPVGRDHLVYDVARAFGTDLGVASSLMSDFGTAAHSTGSGSAFVFVPQPDPGPAARHGRAWPRSMLDKIIALRVEECMTLVRDVLVHDGLPRGAVQSLVITGDTAELPGVQEMAQQIVGLRCRIGLPTRPRSLPEALRRPGWACAAGLVRYAHRIARLPTGGQRQETRHQPMQREETTA